ncbi:thiolase family protein [Thermodesulfobacteriota bacterium]
MKRRIAIIGATQTKYEESKQNLSLEELVWEVVEKVTSETGLTWADRISEGFGIDSIVSCSEDHWDARVISSFCIQRELGAHQMPEIKVSGDSSKAVYLAVIQILSGKYDVVLVVSHRKESVTVRSIIENCGLDPIYVRPLGLDYSTTAALQANRYMHKYGINEEEFAKVVVRSRMKGQNNPLAQPLPLVTVEDVLKSQVVAYPIKALDVKPISDGSSAMILASEDKARKICDKPIWIKGIGSCYDLHYPGDRDLSDCISLELAARQAYRMAGIQQPSQDIDVAEISADYSYQELLWAEGLGFCERGNGGKLMDNKMIEINCKTAINPSGGLLAGVPSGVAGMSRVAEAFLQIRGAATGRQIEGARTALAHGVCGPCGQSHCVIILGS